jgi:hypothetical protein
LEAVFLSHPSLRPETLFQFEIRPLILYTPVPLFHMNPEQKAEVHNFFGRAQVSFFCFFLKDRPAIYKVVNLHHSLCGKQYNSSLFVTVADYVNEN